MGPFKLCLLAGNLFACYACVGQQELRVASCELEVSEERASISLSRVCALRDRFLGPARVAAPHSG